MIKRSFTVSNPSGLHIRPAGVLASGMARYAAEVTILFGGGEYNAKSVINILSAAIKTGAVIELVCDGPDEEAAMAAAAQLIESGLGE